MPASSSSSTRTKTPPNDNNNNNNDKSFKICSVMGGLDVTRLVSRNVRSLFQGAIDDVELIREVISEAAAEGGVLTSADTINGNIVAEDDSTNNDNGNPQQQQLTTMEEMVHSLDWKHRGVSPNTTTLEAGICYADDRPNRRIERYATVHGQPLVGDREADLAMIEAASFVFPWIVDRKAKHNHWFKNHWNGQSEGLNKEPFPFDSLYTAAWIGSYGDAWTYYPPLNVKFGGVGTMGDVVGEMESSHELPFVKPNLPQHNVDRVAFFTSPYPDVAQTGLSIITALAPVYYTGWFRNLYYDDTYIASTGLDIEVTAVSSLLDSVQNKLTPFSFAIIVDMELNAIVVSQHVVELLWPARTGFETERVTYDYSDGTILNDRRNQTYQVSDTLVQGLTKLDNADWYSIQQFLNDLKKGERAHTTLDITIALDNNNNNDDDTTKEMVSFSIMCERWKYTAEWALLTFAPVEQIENAIHVSIFTSNSTDSDDASNSTTTTTTSSSSSSSTSSSSSSVLRLEGEKGQILHGEATILNNGTLDVLVTPRPEPSWLELKLLLFSANETSNNPKTTTTITNTIQLHAKQTLNLYISIETTQLNLGTSSTALTFDVRDDNYPDCFHSNQLNIDLIVQLQPINCQNVPQYKNDPLRIPDDTGLNCVCGGGSGSSSSTVVEIHNQCVSIPRVLSYIGIPVILISIFVLWVVLENKRKQLADSVWMVKTSDLIFDDPPELAGRGTFGLVLIAEYRGTRVAVKRVIPPKRLSSSKKFSLGIGVGDTNNNSGGGGGGGGKESMESNGVVGNGSVVGEGRRIHHDDIFDFENDDEAKVVEVEKGNDDYDDIDGILNDDATQVQVDEERPSVPTQSLQKQQQQTQRFLSPMSLKSLQTIIVHRRNDNNKTNRIPPPPPPPSASSSNIKTKRRTTTTARKRNSIATTTIPESTHENNEFTRLISVSDSCSSSEKENRRRHSHQFVSAHTSEYSYSSISSSNWGGVSISQGGTGEIRGAATSRNIFKRNQKNKRRKSTYEKMKRDFIDEMRHLSKLRHPCITTVMGAVISNFEEPLLVMEYMDHGSLYDLLHNNTMIFEGDVILNVFRDIALGMMFLHSADPQVVHGDVKSHNILIDGKFNAKISDFGFSIKKKRGAGTITSTTSDHNNNRLRRSASGTPYWMAPELLRGDVIQNTAESDVYSFGIVCYEMYSRKDPYENENYTNVIRDICDVNVRKRPPIPPSMPKEVASLLYTSCLADDPTLRPTFTELCCFLKRLQAQNVEPHGLQWKKKQKIPTIPTNSDDNNIDNVVDHNARRLLNQVFPKHIATALREGRKVEPEHFDCVTIFFSDIVGYTNLCQNISPYKVSDMLDRLYMKFDALSAKHSVFKIETIGDAWMGATNLVEEQSEDHVQRMVRFSVDVMRASSETLIDEDDPKHGFISIRIGFHSGSVLANVVGSRLPKYSVFGDTVNTASRMESNSEPGRICCSDRAADLLKVQDPTVELICRGEISIKGKGHMITYWVGDGSGGLVGVV